MTDTPDIIAATRAFITRMKALNVPEGPTKAAMSENERDKSPVAPLLALRDFIADNMEVLGNSATIGMALDRLGRKRAQGLGAPAADEQGEKLTIPKCLTEIAIGDASKETVLRAALQMRPDEGLFDTLNIAMSNIHRELQVARERELMEELGDDGKRPDLDKLKGDTDKDAGSWRGSLHTDDAPPVDDKQIRNAADAHDATHGKVDDDAIKKSAAGDDGAFKRPSDDRTEYEKNEGHASDREHLRRRAQLAKEVVAYDRLFKEIRKAFNETLGVALGQGVSAGRAAG